jgi:putative transposon-encoded protein
MNEQIEVKAKAFEAIDRVVKSSGNSGRVYLPKGWVGKKVKVLLLEPINNEGR